MRRIAYFIFMTLFAVSSGVAFVSCGGDEPNNPDNGDPIKPDTSVPDPAGTITLSMRNEDYGKTFLDDLYIGDDNNFCFFFSRNYIASIGTVKGLGNVSNIPLMGWATSMAVEPTAGYVIYNGDSDSYTRLYVTDWKISTDGGIIGAEVKYQKPFKGLDESIRCSSKVVLPAEGGMQQVLFDNSSIIPFKVSSSEAWCKVNKASTRDMYFLYDAIVISAEESYNTTAETAIVTIENLYGKKTEINVSREGRGEYISLSNSQLNINDFFYGTKQYNIDLFTNLDPSKIDISSNVDWLSASLSGRNNAPKRQVRTIGQTPVSKAELTTPLELPLVISLQENLNSTERKGVITLKSGNVKCELNVTQCGSGFSLSKRVFTFECGTDSQSESCTFSKGKLIDSFTAEKDNAKDSWVTVILSNSKMTVTVLPNPFEEPRTARIKIMYNYNGRKSVVDEIEVTQKAGKIYDRKVFFESKSSNQTISFPIKEGAKITSSADWCTATPNGSTLVIRATAATTNRKATITVEGVSSKIYVSQSKYSVNDSYSESGVVGTVYSMADGLGRIISTDLGNAAWSIENVDIVNATSKTDGKANTEAIHAIPDWKTLYPAFALVDQLNINGVTGWYLPAKEEYYSGKYWYWSSTQSSSHTAYFCYNNNNNSYKISDCKVIAMHQFSYNFFE